jgi:two-component system response regulator HydG
VLLLAQYFIERFAAVHRSGVKGLSSAAAERLMAYSWPGNVRELQNVLERAVIISDGDIERRHLSLRATPSAMAPPLTDLRTTERMTIERILDETGWNKSKAARRLGLTREQLYGRLRRYGLEAQRDRAVLA